MSASREKKQRIASTTSGATDKQRREAAAAKKARTMTVLYSVIGVVAAVLVILLLLWNNGVFTKNKVVATVGGQTFTATELGYYYYPTVNLYKQYGIPLDDETKASLRQQALDSLHQFAAIAAAADADGYTLSDEGKAQVDTAISEIKANAAQQGTTFTAYIHNAYGRFMNEKVLRSTLTRETLAREYYTSHADTLTYAEEQITGYYDEHTDDMDSFTYSAAFINGAASGTDGADPTDAEKTSAMSVAKATADKLVSDALDGDFDALAEEAAAKDEKSSFTAETTALGSSLAGSLNADCKTWLTDASRKSGDVASIEVADSGYWVLRFDRRFLDESAWGDVDVRHILIKAEVADGATEPTQEAMDAAKAEAQSILDQFNAGAKTAEDFAALAKENSDDEGSKENGGLYEHVTPSTSFFAGFMDWIFADGRKSGDTGLVENTQSGQQGWHVMYLDKQNELLWRSTAVNALKSTDLNAWIEEAESTYALTSDEANLALLD